MKKMKLDMKPCLSHAPPIQPSRICFKKNFVCQPCFIFSNCSIFVSKQGLIMLLHFMPTILSLCKIMSNRGPSTCLVMLFIVVQLCHHLFSHARAMQVMQDHGSPHTNQTHVQQCSKYASCSLCNFKSIYISYARQD